MPRFLSPEWFAQLRELSGPEAEPLAGQPALVVEIAVAGAPEGEVRYQLVVEGARAWAVAPEEEFWPAQLRLSSDYATMSEIASGRLAPFEALVAGRAKVAGDTSVLSLVGLAGLDLAPPELRAVTTF